MEGPTYQGEGPNESLIGGQCVMLGAAEPRRGWKSLSWGTTQRGSPDQAQTHPSLLLHGREGELLTPEHTGP